MMLSSDLSLKQSATPIQVLQSDTFDTWLVEQPVFTQNWCATHQVTGKPGQYILLPGKEGQCAQIYVWQTRPALWTLATLLPHLPKGAYYLEEVCADQAELTLGWCLAHYQFDRYQSDSTTAFPMRTLYCEDTQQVDILSDAISLVRDCINTPAEDCGPEDLANMAEQVFSSAGGQTTVLEGQALLEANFPAIYAVGRASHRNPRFVMSTWGDETDPVLVLVGKGVCFDTGGLNIKTGQYMNLMKKDMGGAAHVLGIAQAIMAKGLKLRLHMLIPCVENAIGPDAYRPGDVVATRSGRTVEITDTDAEGRMVLADALVRACELKPDLVLDFATLTGAARVALGTDCPAMFSSHDEIAEGLMAASVATSDPVWRMPLIADYNEHLKSNIADCCNAARVPYGGAITAALFLEHFVTQGIPWVHFDLMAWNLAAKPGRPVGGEAMGLRAVLAYLEQRYGTGSSSL